MIIKGIIDEDFINYKKISMFVATAICDWKCCIEGKVDISVCQNAPLAKAPSYDISYQSLYDRYINNDISEAIVIGGLEPFLQYEDIFGLISFFRKNGCKNDVVIYTGYNEFEISKQVSELSSFENIIIKFGRYIQNDTVRFDELLGVTLQSSNQIARQIS